LKTKVFLFGEFYIPGRAAIAQSLAYRNEMPTSEYLTRNSGSALKDQAATIYEGHLLRWLKQLACRGAVRNIGPDGHCGQMTLYTSMDTQRLMGNLDRVFPGAQAPTIKATTGDRPSDKLARLLSQSKETEFTSKQIEELTGIQARNMRQALMSRKISAIVQAHKWRFMTGTGQGQQAKLVKC
jgi:hypothetical protein